MTIWPEIYFLRHGQSEWNAQGRVQGGLESRLTDVGRSQAAAQRDILSEIDLDGFTGWTSTLGRARETAEIALSGLVPRIIPDDRLVEIGLGEWEGQLYADLEIASRASEIMETGIRTFDRAPGGEGFEALRTRCLSFLGDLSGPAVLVTHGVTSRMLRAVLLDMDACDLEDLPGGQGVVFHVKNGVHVQLG